MEEQVNNQVLVREDEGPIADVVVPAEKIIDVTQKEFWKSKTFWVNFLLFAAALAYAVTEDLTIGAPIGGMALVNLVLRANTKSGVKWKF